MPAGMIRIAIYGMTGGETPDRAACPVRFSANTRHLGPPLTPANVRAVTRPYRTHWSRTHPCGEAQPQRPPATYVYKDLPPAPVPQFGKFIDQVPVPSTR